MEGFAVRILACAHGTADKEKQSFLENIGKIAEDGLLALVLPEGTPISGEEMLGGQLPSAGGSSSGASGSPSGGDSAPSGASGGGGTGGGSGD